MLSKRLRRRLRQIDGRAARPAHNSSREEPPEKTPSRAALKVGIPGLSRSAMEGRSRTCVEAIRPGGPLEELAPGEVVRCAGGSYWLVTQPAAEMLPHGAGILAHLEAAWRNLPASGPPSLCCSTRRPPDLRLLRSSSSV
jgi:hypothetical protein